MTKKTDFGRRQLVVSLIGLGTQPEAFALSPSSPDLSVHVSRSQFVVVGKVERLIFRGASQKYVPQEFDKEFEHEGSHRALDVVLGVDRVLYKRSATDIPPPAVRIHWPIAKEDRANIIGSRQIVFLGKEHNYRREDGTVVEMRVTVIDPLPIEELKRTIEAISKAVSR